MKNKKRTAKWLGLPLIQPRLAKLLIFVLLFANAGLGYLISTSAATYYDVEVEKKVVELINNYRAAHGKSRLRASKCISDSARRHSKTQYQNGGNPYHDSVSTRDNSCSPSDRSVLQNTGLTFDRGSASKTAAGIVDMWKGSSDHKAQMLKDHWDFIGLGIYRSSTTETIYPVANFGDCNGCGDGWSASPYSTSPTPNPPPASGSSCPAKKGDYSGSHPTIKPGGSVSTSCLQHVQYLLDLIGKYDKQPVEEAVTYASTTYDSKTIAGVKNYQKRKKLKSTSESSYGTVDSETWNSLHGACKYINNNPRYSSSGSRYRCST